MKLKKDRLAAPMAKMNAALQLKLSKLFNENLDEVKVNDYIASGMRLTWDKLQELNTHSRKNYLERLMKAD